MRIIWGAPMENKRPIPNNKKLNNRKEIFDKYQKLTPISPFNNPQYSLGLDEGNKKTGKSGEKFSLIYVWNLPIRVTCPGASLWCESHCYNADDRKDIYDMDKWCINWWWALNDISYLEKTISLQLSQVNHEKVAVRLHSCGDFFSVDYIEMWLRICQTYRNIHFWGYTRSWAVPTLYKSISKLASYDNVQLFASWDNFMIDVPQGWSKSIVVNSNEQIKSYNCDVKSSFVCPEQYNLVKSCADCALCINKTNRDVIFILH